MRAMLLNTASDMERSAKVQYDIFYQHAIEPSILQRQLED
jgi:hypothetical protein